MSISDIYTKSGLEEDAYFSSIFTNTMGISLGKYKGKPLYCNFYDDQQGMVMLCPAGSICQVTGTVDEIGDNGTDLIVEKITAVKNLSPKH